MVTTASEVKERNMRRVILVGILCALPLGSASTEPVYNTAVYHEATGSYFELVRISDAYPGQFFRARRSWAQSVRLAAQREYKGRQGRLAVVKSKEVNDFLRDTFQSEDRAWIGLRYWCRHRKLQWVTGELLRPTDYQNWGSRWSVGGNNPGGKTIEGCSARSPSPYRAVHYWSLKHGFTWNAHVGNKHSPFFFVEYPAPKKAARSTRDQSTVD
jgi:hypothetical protein